MFFPSSVKAPKEECLPLRTPIILYEWEEINMGRQFAVNIGGEEKAFLLSFGKGGMMSR
jgi:hypothetical protein